MPISNLFVVIDDLFRDSIGSFTSQIEGIVLSEVGPIRTMLQTELSMLISIVDLRFSGFEVHIFYPAPDWITTDGFAETQFRLAISGPP